MLASIQKLINRGNILRCNIVGKYCNKNGCSYKSLKPKTCYSLPVCYEKNKEFLFRKLNMLSCDALNSSTKANIEVTIEDRVATIKFESVNSQANILSLDMIKKLIDTLDTLNKNDEVDIIMFRSLKPKTFFAGADISFINTLSGESAYNASKLFQRFITYIMEDCKPTIAIVEGQCLGGGLELALACTYSVGFENSSAKFGFPEVMLGFVPAGLGTYLSFLKCKHKELLTMMITGKFVDVHKAKKIGILSHMCPSIDKFDTIENTPIKESHILNLCSINAESALFNRNKLLSDTASSFLKSMICPKNIYDYIRRDSITGLLPLTSFFRTLSPRFNVLRHNYDSNPAPLEILSLYEQFINNSYKLPYTREIYADMEARAFQLLLDLPHSKNYRNILSVKSKISKHIPDLPIPATDVKKIGVIGAAGLMGRGIMELSASRGCFEVHAMDINEEMLQQGIHSFIGSLNKNQTFNKNNYADYKSMINMAKAYKDLANCDMVIEAIPEILDLKRSVLDTLECNVSPKCIIATNTSAFRVTEIAERSKHPERFLGMHYFSPVRKMELLEIVAGEKTSKETLATALDVGKKQGKICVIVKDSPGFYTTRVMASMLAEVLDLYGECHKPRVVDRELRLFGFPMDVSELIDDVGIDVCVHILKYLSAALGDNFNIYRETVIDYLANWNCLGKKSCEGINKYNSEGLRSTISIPSYNFHEYIRWLPNYVEIDQPHDQITERVLLRLLNECCKCLEEDVIPSPEIGDISSVFGIGFPANHGGPFRYIDAVTASKIVDDLNRFYEQLKVPSFKPCKLLVDMAASGEKFYH